MRTSYTEQREFLEYIVHKDYYKFLKNELNKYIQHGTTSIYKHSQHVAFFSYKMAKLFKNKFNANIDFEALIKASYMHDLFMYDWHEKTNWHRLHGYTHPALAAQNAEKYCNATQKEIAIIKTHMWPLTITKIPKSKEAWILTLCDKYSTIKEFFVK